MRLSLFVNWCLMAQIPLQFWIHFLSTISWLISSPKMPSIFDNLRCLVKTVCDWIFVFSLLLQVDNTWVTHMAEFIIENISTNMVRLTMELALSCKRITTQIAVYCIVNYSWNSSAQFQYRWSLRYGWIDYELVSALRLWKLLVNLLI